MYRMMSFVVENLEYIFLAAIAVLFIVIVITLILRSPFRYPYFRHTFDVTGRKSPQIEDLIDEYLIKYHFKTIGPHEEQIKAWKDRCLQKIDKSILKKYRKRQFDRCLDDAHAYRFKLTRKQTRYKQSNYVRHAYKVTQTVKEYSFDYEYLRQRCKMLEEIDYECGLRAYHSRDQRKLLTNELRAAIMERDHYTCRMCGKYMPDRVGLQIDHIVPVAKGGKTVPSNLQVLCSVCNGKKSDKLNAVRNTSYTMK